MPAAIGSSEAFQLGIQLGIQFGLGLVSGVILSVCLIFILLAVGVLLLLGLMRVLGWSRLGCSVCRLQPSAPDAAPKGTVDKASSESTTSPLVTPLVQLPPSRIIGLIDLVPSATASPTQLQRTKEVFLLRLRSLYMVFGRQ